MDWASGFVERGDIRLHYLQLRHEQEQPVVFVHGFTDNASCCQALGNGIADIATPIAYDIRGHGLSSRRPPYTPESLAADCVSVCEELCDTPPILYGHSLGAEIAARAASETSVAGLILEDPPAALEQAGETGSMEDLVQNLHEWRIRPHDGIKREYAGDSTRFADAIATARKQLRPEVARIRNWEYTSAENLIDPLTVPCLILRPDSDTVDYFDESDAVHGENVSVIPVEGAGHTIARDAYPEVVGHIRGFIDKHGVD